MVKLVEANPGNLKGILRITMAQTCKYMNKSFSWYNFTRAGIHTLKQDACN